jgi:NAD(P)-dependent dehydrogenase (short-subunit alcohol dehydrogenase family)
MRRGKWGRFVGISSNMVGLAIPIKRLGEPGDMTGAILFLTSDDAAFITGQPL